MTQMNTDYHDDLIMKKIFAFFASLREIIEFFQWTHLSYSFLRAIRDKNFIRRSML